MEKLMKPAEYAKELGISRQAVYAKIKRGILKSKNVEGKLYIIVDSVKQKKPTQKESTISKKTVNSKSDNKDYASLLAAKDETISVLKGTVKDLKKTNKQVSTTLRSEIDLLKEAFHEMRALYVNRLEYKGNDIVEVESDIIDTEDDHWISVKKFLKSQGITEEKRVKKLVKKFKKAYKNMDNRFIRENGKLRLNANKTYEDIVK